jgi:hypothetical protein
MFAMTGASSAFIGVSILLQAPNWATDFDHSWIDLPGLEAMGVPVTLAVGAIIHNPVPLAGLWTHRHKREWPERPFIAMVGGVLIAGIVIVLATHAFKPIVVDRYLIAVPVLVCALMAVPAARLALDGMLFLLVLVSVAVAAGPLVHSGIKPKWREGAQTIAAIVADCPTTQVFAAKRLGDRTGRADPYRPARGSGLRPSLPAARGPSLRGPVHRSEWRRICNARGLSGAALVRAHAE